MRSDKASLSARRPAVSTHSGYRESGIVAWLDSATGERIPRHVVCAIRGPGGAAPTVEQTVSSSGCRLWKTTQSQAVGSFLYETATKDAVKRRRHDVEKPAVRVMVTVGGASYFNSKSGSALLQRRWVRRADRGRRASRTSLVQHTSSLANRHQHRNTRRSTLQHPGKLLD